MDNGIIGLKNFTKIIGCDPIKYNNGLRQMKLRNLVGFLKGAYSEDENYVFNFKPLICKDYGIPVLVDDDPEWIEGCKKYGIKLIDPINCIPKQLPKPKDVLGSFPKNNPWETKFTDFTKLDDKK